MRIQVRASHYADPNERADNALYVLQEHYSDTFILDEVLSWMDSSTRAHCLEDIRDELGLTETLEE